MTNPVKTLLSDLAGPVFLGTIRHVPAIDIMGPRVQILHALNDHDSPHCLMLVTVPPGVTVPLHSHADPESFYITAGTVDMLEPRAAATWNPAAVGDFVHIAPDVQHAFRNSTNAPAAFLCATTVRMGQFFEAVGETVAPTDSPALPSAERITRFVAAAESFGYWLGSPEENAAFGI